MPSKDKTVFTCQKCGGQSAKWLGKCPDCGAWNSMAEETTAKAPAGAGAIGGQNSKPISICDVPAQNETRTSTCIGEFDRVLGGGIVPGSLILVSGDPGVGKSTLLMQALNNLAKSSGNVLYVSGEESASQTRLRGERLGASHPRFLVFAENSLEAILTQINSIKPVAVVVDSIQTVWTSSLESAPGSVSQVRESTGKLMVLAKSSGIPIFIVGHVTKDGSIAGPKVLEHIVDVCLGFEGNGSQSFRILRANKNRFGSTNSIGVFTMNSSGMEEVTNPSELFLSDRPLGVSGSVVTASMEGSRPLLVEIQALVSSSSCGGNPRRTSLGVDSNRMALLIAVLEKKVGLHLAGQEVYMNSTGGGKLTEPAVDLAMIMALASSHLDREIPSDTVIFGEVGLAGEVRAIAQPEQRIAEAEKLGFKTCILPAGNLRRVKKSGIKLIGVESVQEAISRMIG